ncbi:hypothetical protein [Oleiagrimonas sp. C23AA]|uniref:hypothetical protein n=1 Tax=Oleiagrimonas sp. C23AA TaxID=2719047 RepID=UPI001420E698|nr:hypothetical protein [Oleiagrimonas sp. C23AA]NII10673.1 hypothetical protein [Oleiagrimonas sp. C23AA]
MEAKNVLRDFPRNTHSGAHRFASRKVLLNADMLKEIMRCAHEEVHEIRERFAEGRRLIRSGMAKLHAGSTNYFELDVALAAAVQKYKETLPSGEQLVRDWPELAKAVYRTPPHLRRRGLKPHGLTTLCKYRYATARDMVPFVLLLAIEGGFNPEALLNLSLDDIHQETILGERRVRISARKGRAHNENYTKVLDYEVVGPLIDLILDITKHIRKVTPPTISRQLFLYRPVWGSSLKGTIFKSSSGPSHSGSLTHALDDFVRRWSLSRFCLAQIRPTLADLISLQHGSLIASQALRHQSYNTTEGHYVGSATRQREEEILGTAVEHLERYVATVGTIDVRPRARAPYHDKGASTPGFVCLDPYDSPISGQRKYRLCRAYGHCPGCQHAVADPSDPLAVAFWLSLDRRINEAQEMLDARAWLDVWSPISTSLSGLLAVVPEEVIEAARELDVTVPQVG